MGRSKRRQALKAVLSAVVAGLVVAPAGASAFADRGASAVSANGTSADAGEALQRGADEAANKAPHDHSSHKHTAVSTENSIAAAAEDAANDGADLSQGATLPTGFADVKVIGNMSEAIAVAFAPDGSAFIALKTGVIKSYDYDAGSGQFEPFSMSSQFADLSAEVNNYWDRGLTGIAVDPQFGTAGHNFVYVNYTYNRDPRDNPPVVPKWGNPAQQYDDCPVPADPDDTSIAGCVVMDRVTRLTAQRVAGPPTGWTMVPGSEKELLASGCFQFGSHASGDVTFGPDGMLYASAGEGASFDSLDYGQYANPCADPANEGGSLRSQDYRSTSDALGVDGTVFRMDPVTGFTPSQATANQWLVAYGQRNPWRLAFRPGTFELWSRDVGASLWEEVNRIPDVRTVTSPINRGWPCYEGSYTGSLVQPGWNALDKPMCESLYAQGTSVVSAPYFSYETRGPKLTGADEDCLNSTSAGSGVAFASTSSNYPAAYKDAMFFSDFARSCIWVLGKLPNGDPDPTNIQRFVEAAETPVDLVTGPGGDIYYVDYGLDENGVPTENAAGVHRIVYTGTNATPTARIVADHASGPAPLAVNFDGTTSTDPDGDTLTYSWDLDGNGSYGDSFAAKPPTRAYSVGTYNVGLQVNDGHGHTGTATQQIQAGNSPPVLGTVTPDDTLTWATGDSINFSATATDPQQGTMPASAFSWNVAIRHCPSDVCHTHNLQTYPGVYSGSFQAPPHEYPSHLLLTVTVTDSGGLTATRTIQLNPKTVSLSFASVPSGATVTVGSTDRTTPYSETFIQGAPVTVTAAPTTGTGATVAAFSGWSDGGARSHTVTPPSAAATYTATYTRPTASLTANPASGPAPLPVTYTASAMNAAGVSGSFTYAWDLDNDGQYDDGTGSTQSRTYNAPGSPVVKVLATDSRGATDSKSTTVTVNNRLPIAAVTATPSSGTAPLSPTFSASGSSDPDGTPLTYAWDLDDDGAFDDATGVTATRSYTGVGPHEVTVQVKDADNGTATASTTVTVTNRVPVAAVTANPTSGNAPLTPAFSASGSSDPDGTALTYAWDLDDDGAFDDATGVTGTRSYTGVGPHKVTVQVKDADNGTATASVTVTVTNSGPTARITSTPSPATGNAPFAVTFNGSSSSDPDGSTLTYAWDLDGDGAYDDGTQTAAGRTYGVGNVTVGLTVTDIDGASSTASVSVTVPNRLPVAVVSANPTSGTAPLAVALGASGSWDPDGTALTYVWDTDNDGQFDDATGPTTSATFGGVGPHVVAVRVTDADNGSATKSVTVTVTNTGPAAHITTNPASGTGPAPLTVAFSGSTSSDPDGGPLTYAWDLDGDGQYDDGTGPTAIGTYPVGTVSVGLRVTDQQATSATTTASVDATNTAPTVTRVSTYPEGTWYVGQTLGFDAAATDPQQDLPDSAYSFVMERQDCDSGCPRVVVQRWTGVSADRFVVPAMPYPSHLYLTATVTDDHGATGTRTLRIDPRHGSLTVHTRRPRLAVSVDGVDLKGGWSGAVVFGSTLRVVAPRHQFKKGVRYVFVKWTDGGARKHDVVVWETPVTVKAVYRRVN